MSLPGDSITTIPGLLKVQSTLLILSCDQVDQPQRERNHHLQFSSLNAWLSLVFFRQLLQGSLEGMTEVCSLLCLIEMNLNQVVKTYLSAKVCFLKVLLLQLLNLLLLQFSHFHIHIQVY